MGLLSGIQKIKRNFNSRRAVNKGTQAYAARYKEYSFFGTQCRDERQYEAVITRWYHTIEKGLAYENFRPGFGKNNISSLTAAMEHYIKAGYSTDTFFFQAALSAIEQYIQKNRSYGLETLELEEKVDKVKLAGTKPGGGWNNLFYSPYGGECTAVGIQRICPEQAQYAPLCGQAP